MNKRGFTLAEVLITLAIIGIIFVLVIPIVVQNSVDKANAAKLSSTIYDIEEAFQTAILFEKTNSLYETQMWAEAPVNAKKGDKAKFVEELDKYLKTNTYKKSFSEFYGAKKVYSITDNGDKGSIIDKFPYISETFAITLKNGVVIFLSTFDNASSIAEETKKAKKENCSLNTKAAEIVIDVNASEMPNVIGKDIFFFILGEDGHLYPFGGKDVARITSGGEWNSADSTFACTDSIKGASTAKGLGCTARIIADGYKINY